MDFPDVLHMRAVLWADFEKKQVLLGAYRSFDPTRRNRFSVGEWPNKQVRILKQLAGTIQLA
jgi:hypothetical protein